MNQTEEKTMFKNAGRVKRTIEGIFCTYRGNAYSGCRRVCIQVPE